MFEFEKEKRLKLGKKMKSIPINSSTYSSSEPLPSETFIKEKIYLVTVEIKPLLNTKFFIDEFENLIYNIDNNDFFNSGKIFTDLLRHVQKKGWYTVETYLHELNSLILELEKFLKHK